MENVTHGFDAGDRSKIKRLTFHERRQRVAALILVLAPLMGFLGFLILLAFHGIGWWHFAILGAFYLFTGFGITMGYHRLFTHKSFEAASWLKILLCIAGSMAFQGPVTFWSAVHRMHHQYSDRDGDPHSPNLHPRGFLYELKGIWHAHIGWMFALSNYSHRKFVPDLFKDRKVMAVTRAYWWWVVAGIVAPGLFALPFNPIWSNFLTGCMVGGLSRIFLVSHVTWSVNSLCHRFGKQPYKTEDSSRNNLFCAIWSLGEGWHNNHHAFPNSARHGFESWQPDPTYWLIRWCRKIGCVKSLRIPNQTHIRTTSLDD